MFLALILGVWRTAVQILNRAEQEAAACVSKHLFRGCSFPWRPWFCTSSSAARRLRRRHAGRAKTPARAARAGTAQHPRPKAWGGPAPRRPHRPDPAPPALGRAQAAPAEVGLQREAAQTKGKRKPRARIVSVSAQGQHLSPAAGSVRGSRAHGARGGSRSSARPCRRVGSRYHDSRRFPSVNTDPALLCNVYGNTRVVLQKR